MTIAVQSRGSIGRSDTSVAHDAPAPRATAAAALDTLEQARPQRLVTTSNRGITLDAPRASLPVITPQLADKDSQSPVFWSRIPVGQPLFAHGVSERDVRQGGWDDTTRWGDCYFLAALAAVAQRSPEHIRSMVKEVGDGTYIVRLHDTSGRPRPVRIDGTLPSSPQGEPLYAYQQRDNQYWVALIEKAFASANGGYEAIGAGADGASGAFRVLTGAAPRVYDPSLAKADELWNTLREAERAGSPMATGSKADVPLAERDAGFDEDHEYTLIGTESDDSGRYVVLRNQLELSTYRTSRYDTRARAGTYDEGIFRVRLDDFQRWCDELSILPPLRR